MNVTIAKLSDIPSVVDLSEQLYKETQYTLYNFNRDKVTTLVRNCISGNPKEGIILLSTLEGKTVGVLGALSVEPTFSVDRLATEWIWWVDKNLPDYKKRLLELYNGYEYWARNVAKCKAMMVGRMFDFASSKDFLPKRGYRIVEQTYIKELN